MKKPDSQNWKKAVLILFVLALTFFALSGYMAKFINMGVSPLIATLQGLGQNVAALKDFFTPDPEIELLQAQNSELNNRVAEMQVQIVQLQQALKEADTLYALLGFARSNPDSEAIPAAVIGRDPSPFLKYILIDKGTDNGLRAGMPVETDKGLVGRIEAVTASAARVKLITDSTSVINGTIVEIDEACVVRGSITGDINIEMVSPDAELAPGQMIQTSGLGGDFPAEIVIGQVLNENPAANDLFKSASLQASVDFDKLDAVLVIANFQPSNIGPLQFNSD